MFYYLNKWGLRGFKFNMGMLALCLGGWLDEFSTRSDTNWAVQPQVIARGLKF